MKFDTKAHYKKEKDCEHWLVVVRHLAVTLSISMRKK